MTQYVPYARYVNLVHGTYLIWLVFAVASKTCAVCLKHVLYAVYMYTVIHKIRACK